MGSRVAEQIARELSARRRAIGVRRNDLTPSGKRREIYAPNLEKYDGELGPRIECLRNVKRKSWEEIIESATRTGGKDLGL